MEKNMEAIIHAMDSVWPLCGFPYEFYIAP